AADVDVLHADHVGFAALLGSNRVNGEVLAGESRLAEKAAVDDRLDAGLRGLFILGRESNRLGRDIRFRVAYAFDFAEDAGRDLDALLAANVRSFDLDRAAAGLRGAEYSCRDAHDCYCQELVHVGISQRRIIQLGPYRL